MGSLWSTLSMVSDTSAKLTGLRISVPLKITSSIFEPRRILALRSPRTQRIDSEILLFPQPLGPTTHVSPGSNEMVVLFAKDLKPKSSIFLRYINFQLLFLKTQ